MPSLLRFWAILCADFLQRSRSGRFWVVLGVIAGLTWLSFPPLTASYAIVALGGQYRGVYSSAWVGMVLAMLSVLLCLFGFYMVRGTLVRDFDTRVWQLLVSTPMTRRSYLLAKWCSHMLVLSSIMLVSLAVGLLAQWWRAEDLRVDLWELVKPSLVLGLPGLGIMAMLAIWFDMLPPLRRTLGNVIFFFLWITLIGAGTANLVRQDAGDGRWLSDVNGMALLQKGLIRQVAPQFDNQLPKGFCIGCGGIKQTGRRFQWPSWQLDARDLPGRVFWLLVAMGGVLLAAPLLDRCAARTSERSASSTQLSGRQLRWLDRLLAPLQRGRAGVLLAAELQLVLRQRKLWWWLGMAVSAGVQLLAPPAAAGWAVLASWLLLMDVLSRSALRDLDSGTAALVFCAPGAQRRLLWARALMLLVLVGVSTLPAMLRFALTDVAAAAAVLVLGASLVAWGLALGAATRNARAFELLLCLLAYITTQGSDVLNVVTPAHSNTLWHLALLPLGWTTLALAWPRLHAGGD